MDERSSLMGGTVSLVGWARLVQMKKARMTRRTRIKARITRRRIKPRPGSSARCKFRAAPRLWLARNACLTPFQVIRALIRVLRVILACLAELRAGPAHGFVIDLAPI